MYPGIPKTNELTFSRGAVAQSSPFYQLVVAAIEGRPYRTNLTLWHFKREGRSSPFNRDVDLAPARAKRYRIFEAIPTFQKPGEDFDSGSSEVSVEEIRFKFERWEPIAAT